MFRIYREELANIRSQFAATSPQSADNEHVGNLLSRTPRDKRTSGALPYAFTKDISTSENSSAKVPKVQKVQSKKNKIKREERDEWEFATLPLCQSKFLKVSKFQSFTTKIQKERHSDTATRRKFKRDET